MKRKIKIVKIDRHIDVCVDLESEKRAIGYIIRMDIREVDNNEEHGVFLYFNIDGKQIQAIDFSTMTVYRFVDEEICVASLKEENEYEVVGESRENCHIALWNVQLINCSYEK